MCVCVRAFIPATEPANLLASGTRADDLLVNARLDEDVGARLLLLAITLLDLFSAPLGGLEMSLVFSETND